MYEQVKPIKGKSLNCSFPSSFSESLEKAFGSYPCVLSKDDIPVLRGMAVTGSKNMHDSSSPYTDLIKAIEKYGEIRVWSEY